MWLWDLLAALALYAWIFPQHRNTVIAALDAEIDSLDKEHKSFAEQLEEHGAADEGQDFFSRRSDLTKEFTATLARVAGSWPARKEVREAYVGDMVALNRELRGRLVELGVIPAPEAEAVTMVGNKADGGDVRRRHV
ncbi:hypothetical protein GGTG_14121 [Gaeumannomyces tritici R3-111a-1]|uniref:Uncharacterized protein n=1 Tax=Gaeumannomyces tritici (strain R3-111a-1) TaxID=644352 RepID=J3PKQ6_GAET3|nr:hypothetical protein GGTG_14121 [Gaeumannomyces tritici R3-111a-1]EJT68300.1 hypothetical protein GGTG_14121 [Gaeumannomyces tritici R3-111a-1]